MELDEMKNNKLYTTEENIEVAQAALLYSSGKYETKKKCAIAMGIDETNLMKFNRLLEKAKKRGWLNTEPLLNTNLIDQSILNAAKIGLEVKVRVLESLIKKLEKINRPCKVDIIPEKIKTPKGEDWFYHKVMVSLCNALKSNTDKINVGVAYGKTLYMVASHLCLPHIKHLENAHFFPLCGMPIFQDIITKGDLAHYSSSVIAEDFHIASKINCPSNKGESLALDYTLSGIPAYIPTKYKNFKKQYLEKSRGYNKIFFGKKCIANNFDAIITGIGTAHGDFRHLGTFIAEILHITNELEGNNLSWTTMDNLIYGDICGIFMEKPSLSNNEQTLIQKLNLYGTGIKKQHLKLCTQKGLEKKSPGVILVADGKEHAEMVLATINEKLVNHLIIDRELAKALNKKIN